MPDEIVSEMLGPGRLLVIQKMLEALEVSREVGHIAHSYSIISKDDFTDDQFDKIENFIRSFDYGLFRGTIPDEQEVEAVADAAILEALDIAGI